MPKCKIIDCEKEAISPFECCSKYCGWRLKNIRADLDQAFDADRYIFQKEFYDRLKAEGGNPEKPKRLEYSVEQAIYYQ